MQDHLVDLADQPHPLREAVLECEVRGRRTLFRRGDRPVAVLVSWDEYLALAETVAVIADAGVVEQLRRGAEVLDAEDPEVAGALESLRGNPIAGVPLFAPLRGFWSYRSGALRLIYRLSDDGRITVVHAGRTPEERS